jgi:hypothetical protein
LPSRSFSEGWYANLFQTGEGAFKGVVFFQFEKSGM